MPDALDLDFLSFQAAIATEYGIERELGRGGMGIVYLAREVRLDRYVAIKLLPPSLAARPELRERFVREARTAAKLSHPHIVQIHRVDEVGGFVFFVMAFIDGVTLGARVRERGALPVPEATRLLREVAWALAYAHLHGVVHRDVKPDNILVERDTGRAIVTDFGIAHVGEPSASADDGLVLGTAHFMSPEQARGDPPDGRSDLYSLGIVGYYALTGRLPYDAPTTHAVIGMHLAQAVPSVTQAASATPRPIADAIERCLAKEPAMRWATGEALAAALDAGAEQRRVIAVPIRSWMAKKSSAGAVSLLFAYVGGLPLLAFRGPIVLPLLFGVPMITYVGSKIHKTRRVFKAGYAYDDLILGLREQLELRGEELAFDGGSRRAARIGRMLRNVAYGFYGAGVAALGLGAVIRSPGTAMALMIGFAIATGMGTLTGGASIFFPPSVDHAARRQLGFWRGPVGRWIARMSELGLERSATPQLGHRPTEVAISLAASELFRTLPRETRRDLAGLPGVIERLENEARAIRERLETIATRGDAARTDPALSQLLAEQRADADRHLAIVVSALQTIRLDLLRLHGGTDTTASLTTAIESARELSRQIGYQVEGRREVDAALE